MSDFSFNSVLSSEHNKPKTILGKVPEDFSAHNAGKLTYFTGIIDNDLYLWNQLGVLQWSSNLDLDLEEDNSYNLETSHYMIIYIDVDGEINIMPNNKGYSTEEQAIDAVVRHGIDLSRGHHGYHIAKLTYII
jgi:hypothetical protein